ncbi:MAG: redoxin domain-containing protein [Chitinophagaceae bacterium]|nr:redoxin domain-containing protein [Chitinophagaceae bacterium]
MKKIMFLFLNLLVMQSAIAQSDSLQPPYKRFPTYPPVKLLLPDSISFYTKADLPKKAAIMLMLFNPECEHCKQETEDLISKIDRFKNIQVVMATNTTFSRMLAFRETYQLAKYKNIIVAQDTHYFLPTFLYDPQPAFPCIL